MLVDLKKKKKKYIGTVLVKKPKLETKFDKIPTFQEILLHLGLTQLVFIKKGSEWGQK